MHGPHVSTTGTFHKKFYKVISSPVSPVKNLIVSLTKPKAEKLKLERTSIFNLPLVQLSLYMKEQFRDQGRYFQSYIYFLKLEHKNRICLYVSVYKDICSYLKEPYNLSLR